MKTCLNRFLGRCDCDRDYNTEHHPNNYDGPNYYEIDIHTFTVEKNKELKKQIIENYKNALGRKI